MSDTTLMTGTTDFLFLHGTVQSPAGWSPLIGLLDSLGYNAVALDMAAQGDVKSLAECVDAIVEEVGPKLSGPIVVAHSASGAILPAVATRLGAARQVWLAAWVPDDTKPTSLLSEVTATGSRMMNQEWLQTTGKVIGDAEAAYFLFHDCDYQTLLDALPTVRPWSPGFLYSSVPEVSARGIPSTYLLPTLDRTLAPSWMAATARDRLGVEPILLPTGHCPHTTHPDLVASALLAAAKRERR